LYPLSLHDALPISRRSATRRGSWHGLVHGGLEAAGGEQHLDGLTLLGLLRAVDDATAEGVHRDAVATLERLLGGERAKPCPATLQAAGSFPQSPNRQRDKPLPQTAVPQATGLDAACDHLPAPQQPPAAFLQGSFPLPEYLARIALAQHPLQVVHAFAPPRKAIKRETVARLPAPLNLVSGGDQGAE